jgi:hypothetical protein
LHCYVIRHLALISASQSAERAILPACPASSVPACGQAKSFSGVAAQ